VSESKIRKTKRERRIAGPKSGNEKEREREKIGEREKAGE